VTGAEAEEDSQRNDKPEMKSQIAAAEANGRTRSKTAH